MTIDPKLSSKTRSAVLKALSHLEYSYKKALKTPFDDPSAWSEEQLETLESFSSRFARTADLFVSRFLRMKALEQDPGFRGSMVDLLNLAEKSQLIDSARTWLRIRELRNVAAHEYESEDLAALYRELLDLTPTLLAVRSRV